MNKKIYLFDFDGTLVDSMPYFVSVMLKVLDSRGIKYGKDIVKIITPLGYSGTAKYFRTLGIEESEEEIVAQMQSLAKYGYTYEIDEKPNTVSTIKKLKENGAVLNILTASPHSALDPCLKRLGIFDLFDNVWSCEDFGTTKADPTIYKLAAEKIGAQVNEVIFVDDNVNAVKTAKSAGMIPYGIFDESSKEYKDEMLEICDRYIDSITELLN